ncbi:MAG: sulfotransferase family 2 domain-containing protein [Actinomycetia bacterium]|nr:sulfotransferase family 2 domain-containing protein [Actinomycetes bacterium]
MMQIDGDPYVDHSLRTSMFFPATRLFVAGNPKAAGTMLRWWLLSAHGVDVGARTAESWWGESAPFQTVWDPGVDLDFAWGDLSDSQREDALTSTDLLTVHPVRHPVSRLFSAWSGKYLIGEPHYTERLAAEFHPLPETIGSEGQISELFERFVADLHQVVEAGDFAAVDVHFWPQHRLLGRPASGDVLELRQETMREGLDTIAQHLLAHELDPGEPLRINETVVPYRAELVSDAALKLTCELYTADFARWGYALERPSSSSRTVNVDWVNDVRGRNRRYGVLHRALMQLRHENDSLRGEIGHLRGREHELLDSTSWKVTGPLRWVSDKTKR